MPKKLSRKLAGCFAIELLFAAGLLAANPDYQAGTAAAVEFRLSQAAADFIAAQVVKAYGLIR
jgi:hypothetical protein